MQMAQDYSTQQEALEGNKSEYKKVWTRYRTALGDKNDLQDEIHREREDLMDRIRELTREIRLKHLIIDSYIPAYEYMKIERMAEWNDDTNDWEVPNAEFTGNNIKKNKKKKGSSAYKYMYENVLGLDEESEEEDYETAATMRVQNVINNILSEEAEEEGFVNFVPPEQQTVFYTYTEEGAMREDPEKANKK